MATRTAVALVAMAAAVGVTACSRLSEDYRSTADWAHETAIRITNNRRVEHFEDMTLENLLLAADVEHVDVVAASRLEPRTADSIYQWSELVIRIETTSTGFAPRAVTACWSLVFEGRFPVEESMVECPSGPPPTVPTPSTTEPRPVPTVDVARRDDFRRRIEAAMSDLDSADPPLALRAQIAEHFGELDASEIRVVTVDIRVGVAIELGGQCWYGFKRASVIGGWQPVAGDAGVTCTAERALDGPP